MVFLALVPAGICQAWADMAHGTAGRGAGHAGALLLGDGPIDNLARRPHAFHRDLTRF
jgi:hypothetical protein